MYCGPVPVHTWLPYVFWCQLYQFFTVLLVQLILDFQIKQTIALKAYFGKIASAQQHLAGLKSIERTVLPGDLIMYRKHLAWGFPLPSPAAFACAEADSEATSEGSRQGLTLSDEEQFHGARGWVRQCRVSCPQRCADTMLCVQCCDLAQWTHPDGK